ncbi:A/G-specific adenine glycosylase [Candidatus Kaiserbacteria bacterium]|nr:A/G-specific adenine glycosylase [Candidatus Kaiserbacteria bacterium]
MRSTVTLRVNALPKAVAQFRKVVWMYHKKHGRHNLPWRKTKDPYRILVSEMMLQQTQVERVIPFYKKFIKKFPTAKRLASSSLTPVLQAWQGLGYNRRAKMLHVAAKELAATRADPIAKLEALPGVGPYTALAVAAFAYNENVIFVETNIRTAVIHHFFPERKGVQDNEIEEILQEALPKGRAREWYGALMDYGASLKRSGISHNAQSRQYAKQSKFAGSLREARGAILRALVLGAASPTHLINLLGDSRRAQMRAALRALWKEQLVEKDNENYMLAR